MDIVVLDIYIYIHTYTMAIPHIGGSRHPNKITETLFLPTRTRAPAELSRQCWGNTSLPHSTFKT